MIEIKDRNESTATNAVTPEVISKAIQDLGKSTEGLINSIGNLANEVLHNKSLDTVDRRRTMELTLDTIASINDLVTDLRYRIESEREGF